MKTTVAEDAACWGAKERDHGSDTREWLTIPRLTPEKMSFSEAVPKRGPKEKEDAKGTKRAGHGREKKKRRKKLTQDTKRSDSFSPQAALLFLPCLTLSLAHKRERTFLDSFLFV